MGSTIGCVGVAYRRKPPHKPDRTLTQGLLYFGALRTYHPCMLGIMMLCASRLLGLEGLNLPDKVKAIHSDLGLSALGKVLMLRKKAMPWVYIHISIKIAGNKTPGARGSRKNQNLHLRLNSPSHFDFPGSWSLPMGGRPNLAVPKACTGDVE